MITGRFALPISAGSAPEPPVLTEGHFVRYISPFGDILKEEYVVDGGSSTPPTPPTYNLLTFAEWNNPTDNVTRDIEVGAIYNTTNGKSYVFIEVNVLTGLSPTIYFNKSTTDLLTVDWGDGETSTTTGTGNLSIIKPNSYVAGNYTVTIECAGTHTLGWGTINQTLFGNYISSFVSSVRKIYLGSNTVSLNRFCQNYLNIEYITLSTGLTGPINGFFGCVSLINLNFPTSLTGDILSNAFPNCLALTSVSFPFGLTGGIGNFVFQQAYSLQRLVIPSGMIGVLPSQLCSNAFSLISVTLTSNFTSMSSAVVQNSYALTKLELSESIAGNFGSLSNLRSMKSFKIPIGATALVNNCFSNWTAMEEYIFQSTVPPTMASTNVFTGIPLICKIYVPDASVTNYKTATNWVIYADYIYPISTRPI